MIKRVIYSKMINMVNNIDRTGVKCLHQMLVIDISILNRINDGLIVDVFGHVFPGRDTNK